MKKYEVNCLVSPNSSIEITQRKIEDYIKGLGGDSINLKNSTKRSLPNFIKKKTHPNTNIAYFLVLSFELATEKIKELEKKIKSEQEILRCLILNKKPIIVSNKRLVEREKLKGIKQEKVKIENIDEKLDEILGDI